MSIDGYVSRTQLPGAAVTRRLALVARAESVPGQEQSAELAALRQSAASPPPALAKRKRPSDLSLPASRPAPARSGEVPKFSLAAMVAGDWLWLEVLGSGALAREQVWLVRSMAQALSAHVRQGQAEDERQPGGGVREPLVTQFDWPIHTNQQLDIGAEAARAGVTGFVARKMQEHRCLGLVILGTASAQWVSAGEFDVRTVTTAGSLAMLADPALKRQVWQDLLTLVA